MGFFYFYPITIEYKMNVKKYLDSTYLKTASQANLSENENTKIVANYIQEAIENQFKLIMIRPDKVALAKKMIQEAKSKVTIGTVIDFPFGTATIDKKLAEAKKAIEDGADDLDFVIDYEAFKRGEFDFVKQQVIQATKFGLSHHKIVKWIIEVAALNNHQIVQLSALIKNVVISKFTEKEYDKVFVKSSTGFYKSSDGIPNGANVQSIKLMLENAFPLPVKAAGGVRTYEDAVEMIRLGVKRIGTSAAKKITDHEISKERY